MINRFLNKIENWDKKIIIKCNGVGGKPFIYFSKFISFFGRETTWFFLIAFFLFIWYDRIFFIYIGMTFFNGVLLIYLIKQNFNRSRPYETMKEIKALERDQRSKSFPSWHVYNVTSQALIFGYLFNSVLIALILLIIAILVSFSRMHLGVHYPSDVIFGFFLGILGFFLTIFLYGPLFLSILLFLEQFAFNEIYYQQINLMLFNEEWYIILCTGIFGFIIFSAFFKIIQEEIRNRKKE